ncbi:hypothetical protein M2137_002699 [Parabacteroides sp. PFB2-10]|uniref:hypothetical protein n=1 Tax=Parabacteroides sp. PFB2-10 TaxID=1742405 RepID=UPI0024733CF4|nr:hypothetical protein [Parabacteroides sp. PFB2-10]MDH6313908.1 hypothetical protein [Parabacteroides sp. PFB2-10]
MKYYIALSSLNIDNILSSESISPYSFYSKRDFGYRTFQKLDHISINNSLVLFSEIPFFEIRDLENENYPMVIEIEDDYQLNEKNRIQKINSNNPICDIYLCSKTIYLTPWNCRIFFFSSQAMRLAILKCEDSLCNKIGNLFRIELITPNKFFALTEILNEKSFSDFDFEINEISKDNKINKIKGFLYGYYLGATKSLPKEIGQLLGIQKHIYNLVSSIISNKDGNNELFKIKIEALDKEYDKIDPHKRKLKELWEEMLLKFSSENDKNEFNNILRNLNVAYQAKMNFASQHNIPIRRHTYLSTVISSNWIDYRDELCNYTKKIIDEGKNLSCELDLINNILIQDDYSTVSIQGENTEMYNSIMAQFFFDRAITIEDLRLRIRDITKEIVSEIKSIIEIRGGIWDESINNETKYLKDLQRNMIKNEPFNLQTAPDVCLLSIAAFLLKGDDYEDLMRYLEENGVSDYKYVLGLWGAACGYVDMPKTIFNQVLKNKNVFCEAFKSIYYLLLKEKLNGGFPEIDITLETGRKQEEKGGDVFSPKVKKSTKNKEKKVAGIKEEDPEEKCIREKLKQAKITEKQIDSVIDAWKNNHFLINEKLFSIIPNQRKTTIEKIKTVLLPNQQKIPLQQEPTLDFSSLPEKEFYLDENVLSFLEVPSNKKKEVKEEIDWIQKVHKDGGYKIKTGSWKSLTDHSNKEVIKHFENNSKGRIEPNLLNQIVVKLKELYLSNE